MRVRKLLLEKGGKIVQESSDYGSKPWGFEAEHNFINRVIEIETALSAYELLERVMQIESSLGRNRILQMGYESRSIDVDILFYDNFVIDKPELTIPHPRLHLRRFTLLPLVEKWAELQHPILKKSMIELLKDCPDQGEVWLIN